MAKEFFNSGGVSTYLNPIGAGQDGQLIHSVNMVSFPYGAKSKRSGYNTFLGAPDNSQVQSLFAFPNIGNDSNRLNLYRASGSSLYYSLQGTAPWALAGGGTIANGGHFGYAIGNAGTVLIGGDGVGSTRHTADGTSFTNTPLAPISEFWANYHNRAYAAGTQSSIFFSVTNDVTNWNLAGTADSSSFTVPNEGKLGKIFLSADRLIASKNRGGMYSWDDFSLEDLTTKYGPSSPYSVAETEDYRFWINQYGHFGYDGAKSQLLSNSVQRYFYNNQNSGIAGTAFPTIPAISHFYDYYASIGTVTDNFTQRTIPNAILNYNYQKNEYLMQSFADNPTSYLSYNDVNSKRQLIFGNASGQCFQLDPTATTDNGAPIPSEMVYLFNYSSSSATQPSGSAYQKKWNWIRLFFNPGCEVNIQGAFSDTFTYEHLKWFDIVDQRPNPQQRAGDGIVEMRLPQGSRSRLFFLRIYESSNNASYIYYGCQLDADIMTIN